MRIQHFIDRLEEFCMRQGVSVRRSCLGSLVSGHLEQGVLVLRTGLTKEQQLLTLVHELTHLLVHFNVSPPPNRTICEYEAQAVERLVGAQLGLAAYAGDSGDLAAITDDLLACSVDRVRRVAGRLMTVARGDDLPPAAIGLQSQAAVQV